MICNWTFAIGKVHRRLKGGYTEVCSGSIAEIPLAGVKTQSTVSHVGYTPYKPLC